MREIFPHENKHLSIFTMFVISLLISDVGHSARQLHIMKCVPVNVSRCVHVGSEMLESEEQTSVIKKQI